MRGGISFLISVMIVSVARPSFLFLPSLTRVPCSLTRSSMDFRAPCTQIADQDRPPRHVYPAGSSAQTCGTDGGKRWLSSAGHPIYLASLSILSRLESRPPAVHLRYLRQRVLYLLDSMLQDTILRFSFRRLRYLPAAVAVLEAA